MDIKYWELIAKYLSEDFSAEEKKELFDWINKHPENEQRFKQIQNIWHTLKVKEERQPDLKKKLANP